MTGKPPKKHASSKNGQKTADGRFAAGNKFGRGRPKGSRNKASLAVDALLEGEAEALTQKAIDGALEGDMTALRLCLERLCPPRKDRPVSFDLPPIDAPADAVTAMSALLAAVAEGTVTPGEAQTISTVIEAHRRTLETEDIEQRLAALEADKGIK